MIFESNMSILYSDIAVPEVFVTEHLHLMDSFEVKIYIYCLFLSKHGKSASAEDLSKALDLNIDTVKKGLEQLENRGLIVRDDNRITIVDLKEMVIKKLYRPKNTSTPEEAALNTERNKKRNDVIRDINHKFFQGVMSPTWYTDIDDWFDKYGFEEDVMFALFEYCYMHNGLSKAYIIKVAESWHSRKIKNAIDLDNYFMEYEKLKDIKNKIKSKIRRKGMLTEYEEAYVEKWVYDYGYDFTIIERALRKTTYIYEPNFEFINKILTDWHNNNLKTIEDIERYENLRKTRNQPPAGENASKIQTPVPQKGNFEQRKYDDEFFDKLYKDV